MTTGTDASAALPVVGLVIRSVAPVLGDLPEPGETVQKVARGIANYPIELLFGNGALTLLYNRYAILCTDRRLLTVNTTCRMKRPSHYLFQIPYSDIRTVKRGFLLPTLAIKRKTGKKRIFNHVERFSLKEITGCPVEVAKQRSRMPFRAARRPTFVTLWRNCARAGGGRALQQDRIRTTFHMRHTAWS